MMNAIFRLFLSLLTFLVILVPQKAITQFTPSTPKGPSLGTHLETAAICPHVPIDQEHSGKQWFVEGDIRAGMNETVILSYDQKQLTFCKTVNQVIKASDSKDYWAYTSADATGFADPSNGKWNASFKDFNFDGYNDFSSEWSAGVDVQSYIVFLFDPIEQRFVYNKALSALGHLDVDQEDKELLQSFCAVKADPDTCRTNIYQWLNGKLMKTGSE